MSDELRFELARVAASLRAYLEWQRGTGAVGLPRRAVGHPPVAREDAPPEPSPPISGLASPAPPRPPEARTDAERDEPIVAVQARHDAAPPPTEAQGPALATRAVVAAPAPVMARRPLPVVEEEVRGCVRCDLARSRTQTVFARGNPEAHLCFIGEAPGADEDAQGLPFVGRAGQLLDRMIAAMGLDPERDTYICNVIKCRPPENRTPEAREIEACLPYLHEQLEEVAPKVIVTLGNTALVALLGDKRGITRARGAWKFYRGRIPVMPTYHPSFLLRPGPQQTDAKRKAWADLQEVMRELHLPPRKA